MAMCHSMFCNQRGGTMLERHDNDFLKKGESVHFIPKLPLPSSPSSYAID